MGWTNATDAEVKALLTRHLDQLRTKQPHAMLGLTEDANANAVRKAFLQATKVYHPNRFARRGTEIVKLANEVFLQLKGAYQQISKPPARRSGLRPALQRRTAAPPTQTPPLGSPRVGAPSPIPRARPPMQTPPLGSPRARPPMQTPPLGSPKVDPSSPSLGARTNPLPARRARTTQTTRPIQTRKPAQTGPLPSRTLGARRSSPPADAGRPTSRPPRTTVNIRSRARRTTPQATTSRSAPAASSVRDHAMAECRELCAAGKWDEARALLTGLSTRHPDDREVFAFLHYVQGRQHQDNRDLPAARAEFRRALDIDPRFDDARQALRSLVATIPGRPGRSGPTDT